MSRPRYGVQRVLTHRDNSPTPEEIAAECALIRAENLAYMRSLEHTDARTIKRRRKHWSYYVAEDGGDAFVGD